MPAIFGSEVFPSPVLEQIGQEAGVRYVDVLRDDDLPGEPGEPEHSWLGLMRFDYVTMTEALGGDARRAEAFEPGDVAPDTARVPAVTQRRPRAAVELAGVDLRYAAEPVLADVDLTVARARVRRHRRAVGLGQDDAAARDRRQLAPGARQVTPARGPADRLRPAGRDGRLELPGHRRASAC